MSLKLGQVVRRDGWSFAVICDQRVSVKRWGNGLMAHGNKTPAAIVFRNADGLVAFDLNGRPIDPVTLDTDCPGLLKAFGAQP